MSALRISEVVNSLVFFSPFLVWSVCWQTQWVRVETVRYDWNHDGKPYTFLLDHPKDWEGSGDYARLRIFMPNGTHFSLVDEDGLTGIDDSVGPKWVTPHLTQLVKKNPVESGRLLFLPIDPNSKRPFLLFLFGCPYGSSFGSIHVIALNEGAPREILYKKEFQMVDYAHLNGDDSTQIVGQPCMSQEWGAGLLTYDPYHVYLLPADTTSRAKLSIRLSREYNLKHYYGWAGPDCSEKLAIVLHPPGGGKPVIMDAKKAEALTGGNRNP
jgi:hypothetical protein